MPASVAPELQELIGLILSSPRLAEDERASLLDRIAAGDFPPALLEDIRRFIGGEMDANAREMDAISARGAKAHAAMRAEERDLPELEDAEVTAAERQIGSVLTAYQAETDGIVRTAQQREEAGQQATDAASAEALRAMLKGGQA